VNAALRQVLDKAEMGRTEPAPDAPAFAVVFASDQGLAGTFNERVAAAAEQFRAATSGPLTFAAIGLRGSNLLQLRGIEPVLSQRAPTSLEGIKAQVPELAEQIFDAYHESGAEQVFFIFNIFESLGRFREGVRRIVPPVREELGTPGERAFSYEPILTAPSGELLGHLVEEYFFIELYRSLLESHASENGARLTSMTSAASNVEDRLAEIRQQFQTVRQETITAELMDVVSGAEALRRDKRKG
ncbi:unnamed protein product, partial [marine sediment metagenome]